MSIKSLRHNQLFEPTLKISAGQFLIGSGIPLFRALKDDVQLNHIETKSFKNGFVQSKYEVVK